MDNTAQERIQLLYNIQNKKRTFFAFILLVASTVLSIKLARQIGEAYFFDKLFYKKSITHGYNDLGADLPKFGKRAIDAIAIRSILNGEKNISILETSSDTYTVAVLGDSYVWGSGVKNEERFAHILEKSLNKHRKTRVFSFGLPGNNFLEHYTELSALKASLNINLYILVLIPNDILMKEESAERDISIIKKCQMFGTLLYDYNENDWQGYYEHILKALENKSNQCIAQSLFEILPLNTIVFEPDYVSSDNIEYDLLFSLATPSASTWITSYDNLDTFPIPYKEREKFDKAWRVSSKEGHPSSLTNKFFADILYREIIHNPNFQFIEE